MANYIKKDIETFEYNKSRYIPAEHRWDFMLDDEKRKAYEEEKKKITRPVIGRTQSDPETTGQHGTML